MFCEHTKIGSDAAVQCCREKVIPAFGRQGKRVGPGGVLIR